MKISFDPTKDATNLAKHGVSLVMAVQLDWTSALIWPDVRRAYGEPRQSALALLGERLYYAAFVERTDGRRIISLRKANNREIIHYAKVSDAS